MPWNRKTTRKSRHDRNRHRTWREKLARVRAYINSDDPVIGKPLPSLWFTAPCTERVVFNPKGYYKTAHTEYFSRSEYDS